ncbi:MAG TPA: hypothetical protein VLH14_01585 [Patescibacteria group bacterium]|nr:hypothetical protein [Patescibacteria group bacterium]
MNDPFTTFIKEMLSAKAWNQQVSDEVKTQLESDLRSRLMDQIDQAVVEALPDDKVDGLNELLDREASEAEIQQYIATSGVDVQRITTETMLRFRDLYLGPGDTNGQ